MPENAGMYVSMENGPNMPSRASSAARAQRGARQSGSASGFMDARGSLRPPRLGGSAPVDRPRDAERPGRIAGTLQTHGAAEVGAPGRVDCVAPAQAGELRA